ncbi:MAG: hypothetical protein ACP5GS_04830 [Nitrososphaeria archaeon]|jgi:hypothetical protein
MKGARNQPWTSYFKNYEVEQRYQKFYQAYVHAMIKRGDAGHDGVPNRWLNGAKFLSIAVKLQY